MSEKQQYCRVCRFNPAEQSLDGLCWVCHSTKLLRKEVSYQEKKAIPMCRICRKEKPTPGFDMCWLCSSKFTLINAPKTHKAYIEVVSAKGAFLGTLGLVQGSSATDLAANYGQMCMRRGFKHWHIREARYHNEYHFAQLTTKKPIKMTAYVAPRKAILDR